MNDEVEIRITPEYVIETIEAMFTLVPNSGHAPEHFPCTECGQWQAEALEMVRDGGDPMEILVTLRSTLPNPTYHPNENCIPCYGCRWEQQYAVDMLREVLGEFPTPDDMVQ